MYLFAYLIVTANAACPERSFRAQLSPSLLVPPQSSHIGPVCVWPSFSVLTLAGQAVNFKLCGWDLLIQMCAADQAVAWANLARPQSGCIGFAVFVINSWAVSFVLETFIFKLHGSVFPVSEIASQLDFHCFICSILKFVSVPRLNCGKNKSPDTNGFVTGRCSFSLLFEIIPSESHCCLHYWHTVIFKIVHY